MKTISPIQSWINGKSVTATIFNMYVIGGVLGSSASFYYSLLDSAISKGSDDMLSLSYREVLVAKVYALEQRIKELENK